MTKSFNLKNLFRLNNDSVLRKILRWSAMFAYNAGLENMCICGYRLPLIWTSMHFKNPTVCGGCGKKFMGEVEGKGKNPERIFEETP